MQKQMQAIILRLIDYGEADRIVYFFTEFEGQLHGYIKGVRRLKSKFGGRIDLLNFGQLFYFTKSSEQLASINAFDVEESFSILKSDYEKLYRALAMSELVLHITDVTSRDRQLFKVFLAVLRSMNSNQTDGRTLLVLFLMFLCHHQGYAPRINTCHQCKTTPVFPLYWDSFKNTMFCSRCVVNRSGKLFPLDESVVPFLKKMAAPNVNSLKDLVIDKEDQHKAEQFFINYLKYHLDFTEKTERTFSSLDEFL